MKRLLIVGCGGIGSYLIRDVFEAKTSEQLKEISIIDIADGDDVDSKNLKYQNFMNDDVFDNKAESLGARFGFNPIPRKITTEEELNNYDIVIAAVDSNDFRRLLYKWQEKHPEKFWIDLRSEGRTIAFLTKHKQNTLDFLMSTLNDDAGNSCQLEFELENGIIQFGNKIVASIGIQLLTNYLRGEKCSHFYTRRF